MPDTGRWTTTGKPSPSGKAGPHPGFTGIGGLHAFRDYGSYIENLKAGHAVIIDDVTEILARRMMPKPSRPSTCARCLTFR